MARTKWGNLERHSSVRDRVTGDALSPADVVVRYRGFTGEPWPLEDERLYRSLQSGLLAPDMYEAATAYWNSAQNTTSCDLIYLGTDPVVLTSIAGVRLSLLGWDYGYYESEWNEFSSLFNECIFGRYPQLRRAAANLNENLLFPQFALCQVYGDCRERLRLEGADLETDQETYPIGIYAPLG